MNQRVSPSGPDCADYLFAAFAGLAVVTLLSPLRSVPLNTRGLWILPLITYQDLAVAMILAWIFQGLFAVSKNRFARAVFASAGWVLCLGLALYSYLSIVIFAIVRRPLSYGLIVAGSDVRGIWASIVELASPRMLMSLAYAPILVIVVAVLLSRGWPKLLLRMRTGFFSLQGLALFALLLAMANTWAGRFVPSIPPAFTNPEWALISSSFDRSTFAVRDKFPDEYLTDFEPHARRSPEWLLRAAYRTPPRTREPLNILMVVMESVGARRLALYGAHVDDSAQMLRLSRHAALFNNVHVSEACTSCAMAALFSSVYPDHDWPSITHMAPALGIAGLPAVLARQGYRTAFIHSGQLAFDQQDTFLRTRGFGEIIGEDTDYNSPRDQVLLSKTTDWIENSSQPFFVTIWTQDTHHPYQAAHHRQLASNASRLNDYLNAVDATDDFIGQLADWLQQKGLAENTLLVITGDHGEAFGEHGLLAHGGSVYEEETRIPLMIVNPRLFSRELSINSVAQQIDIAPTLLGLLGYATPWQWQGVDLFRPSPSRRAYLFSGQGTASYGLIDGKFKYIYRVNENSEELYNLESDPDERTSLSLDPSYSALMRRDHLRIEAWVSFQNRYLERFRVSGPRVGL